MLKQTLGTCARGSGSAWRLSLRRRGGTAAHRCDDVDAPLPRRAPRRSIAGRAQQCSVRGWSQKVCAMGCSCIGTPPRLPRRRQRGASSPPHLLPFYSPHPPVPFVLSPSFFSFFSIATSAFLILAYCSCWSDVGYLSPIICWGSPSILGFPILCPF